MHAAAAGTTSRMRAFECRSTLITIAFGIYSAEYGCSQRFIESRPETSTSSSRSLYSTNHDLLEGHAVMLGQGSSGSLQSSAAVSDSGSLCNLRVCVPDCQECQAEAEIHHSLTSRFSQSLRKLHRHRDALISVKGSCLCWWYEWQHAGRSIDLQLLYTPCERAQA